MKPLTKKRERVVPEELSLQELLVTTGKAIELKSGRARELVIQTASKLRCSLELALSSNCKDNPFALEDTSNFVGKMTFNKEALDIFIMKLNGTPTRQTARRKRVVKSLYDVGYRTSSEAIKTVKSVITGLDRTNRHLANEEDGSTSGLMDTYETICGAYSGAMSLVAIITDYQLRK